MSVWLLRGDRADQRFFFIQSLRRQRAKPFWLCTAQKSISVTLYLGKKMADGIQIVNEDDTCKRFKNGAAHAVSHADRAEAHNRLVTLNLKKQTSIGPAWYI
jgi:hypothetical protein